MKKRSLTYEDLDVYQKLCKLHLEISELSFMFPKFELNEIGSELRLSSNAAPASIAKGYSTRHHTSYIERINQALGDIRQTKHHLNIACKKSYIDKTIYSEFVDQYEECSRLLKSLEKSVNSWKSRNNQFTKNQYPNSYHP